MDPDYDIKGAARRLEELALDRYHSQHSEAQLSRMSSPSAHYEAIRVDKNWRLVHKGNYEEVVGLFQGIICKKDLPPFTDKISKQSKHVRYLRQSVTIGGLNTSVFEKSATAIIDIHGILSRSVGISNVQECGMISTFDGMQTVELSNRYFTACTQGTHSEDKLALSPDIDPLGLLRSAAASANLYHGAENTVEYFERQGLTDEDYTYKEAKPVIFDVGDIVEIQASFVIYPLKDGKFKTATILRGLTLLDGTFTQAMIRNKILVNTSAPTRIILKRKTGYMDEQMSSTRSKLTRMEIDGRSQDNQSDVEDEHESDHGRVNALD